MCLSHQMLYASSVLGMYFPFDFCLYPGMPSLVAFGLKFIPAILAAIVAVIVMVGSYIVRYCGVHAPNSHSYMTCVSVCRARSGRKRVWKALWFLVLLLYIPLLHNCVALLKCPLVPNAEGGDEKRVSVFIKYFPIPVAWYILPYSTVTLYCACASMKFNS